MAKLSAQWRGFVPAIGFGVVIAALCMAAFGWLNTDLKTIGGDLIVGIRSYLGINEQVMVAPPPRVEIYHAPAAGEGIGSPGTAFLPKPVRSGSLANHAKRGAVIGTPKLIDANTFVMNGQRMRFWGVDAPDLDQVCVQSGQEWLCGKAAMMALAGFLLNQDIACYEKGRSPSGTIYSQCFVGDIDVNGWLARNGWAVALRDRTLSYVSRESQAKFERLGVWREGLTEEPAVWRRVKGRSE